MKKNLLPVAALMFLCAVLFLAVSTFLLFPSLPLSNLPSVPTFLPTFHFN
ncbi:MAG: hypothetical protein KH054_05415 [Firmicutes bacterium]|nr:hypothetical protein [Bacillota bacterium]